MDPIDYESTIAGNKTLLLNDPQREMLLFPHDDVSVGAPSVIHCAELLDICYAFAWLIHALIISAHDMLVSLTQKYILNFCLTLFSVHQVCHTSPLTF